MGEQGSLNRTAAMSVYIGAKRLPPWELVDLPQLPLSIPTESNKHEKLRSGKERIARVQDDCLPYHFPLADMTVMSAAHSNEPSYSDPRGSTRPLPGTMSSRRVPTKSRKRVAKEEQPIRPQKEDVDPSRVSLSPGGRLTSAVRVLFRKDSVDESQLEAIDHCHWTED